LTLVVIAIETKQARPLAIGGAGPVVVFGIVFRPDRFGMEIDGVNFSV
jgi:hypothetical protein